MIVIVTKGNINQEVKKQMDRAAADLNFEAAAELRDKMLELKQKLNELEE